MLGSRRRRFAENHAQPVFENPLAGGTREFDEVGHGMPCSDPLDFLSGDFSSFIVGIVINPLLRLASFESLPDLRLRFLGSGPA